MHYDVKTLLPAGGIHGVHNRQHTAFKPWAKQSSAWLLPMPGTSTTARLPSRPVRKSGAIATGSAISAMSEGSARTANDATRTRSAAQSWPAAYAARQIARPAVQIALSAAFARPLLPAQEAAGGGLSGLAMTGDARSHDAGFFAATSQAGNHVGRRTTLGVLRSRGRSCFSPSLSG